MGCLNSPPILNPIFLHAHDWLKDRGYKVSKHNLDTAYQVAHSTNLHFFEHLRANPPHGQNFNDHMHGYLLGRPAWMDEGFYPTKQRLVDGFDRENKDAVMLVDVAGGFGHYTDQFRSKLPDAPGRLILQDLPGVLGQIQGLHPRIERMEYDFYTEQPVKGELSHAARNVPCHPLLISIYPTRVWANQRLVPQVHAPITRISSSMTGRTRIASRSPVVLGML